MKTEPEIRDILIKHIRDIYGKETILIPEVYIEDHARRVDLLAIVGSKLLGFEIKSSSDSLARLEPQIQTYEKYLDKAILVCAQNHTSKALTIIGSDTGIWEISTTGVIKKLRRGRLKKIDKSALIRSLTVLDMRKLNKIPTQKITRKELSRISQGFSHSILKGALIESIKRRRIN